MPASLARAGEATRVDLRTVAWSTAASSETFEVGTPLDPPPAPGSLPSSWRPTEGRVVRTLLAGSSSGCRPMLRATG